MLFCYYTKDLLNLHGVNIINIKHFTKGISINKIYEHHIYLFINIPLNLSVFQKISYIFNSIS